MALIEDIEAFLMEQEQISPTALGDRALGDRHFVRQLRAGRRVWPETEDKVRKFMAAYRSQLADVSPGKRGADSPEDQDDTVSRGGASISVAEAGGVPSLVGRGPFGAEG